MKNILHEEILNIYSKFSRKPGVLRELRGDELIVSLTSYPPRFKRLPIVLESLLRQTLKPSRICLWIAINDIQSLPDNVKSLQKRGIEICSCKDILSYKKIVPTLKESPNAIIVTADDDVIYPRGWLSSLYKAHLSHPEEIICHRARRLTLNTERTAAPYRQWPNLKEEVSSLLVFPVGVGGVLYPPHCFDSRVLDEDSFMRLAAHGDDIWLKSMSLLNNVSCRKLSIYRKNFHELRHSQYTALRKENQRSRNDQQIDKVFYEFQINTMLTKFIRQGEIPHA